MEKIWYYIWDSEIVHAFWFPNVTLNYGHSVQFKNYQMGSYNFPILSTKKTRLITNKTV